MCAGGAGPRAAAAAGRTGQSNGDEASYSRTESALSSTQLLKKSYLATDGVKQAMNVMNTCLLMDLASPGTI